MRALQHRMGTGRWRYPQQHNADFGAPRRIFQIDSFKCEPSRLVAAQTEWVDAEYSTFFNYLWWEGGSARQ